MTLSEADIAVLSERLALPDLKLFDSVFVSQILEKRLKESGLNDLYRYLGFAEGRVEEQERFRSALYIGYSEFFRNPLTFAALEQVVIPSLIRNLKNHGKKELRIWSSACAEGQEAFSVAMILEEVGSLHGSRPSYRIFATDISEIMISGCERGVFGLKSLLNVPLRYFHKYFIGQEENFSVIPSLGRNISFSVFDLLDEGHASPPGCIFGDFDIIFCSNLLFYYRPDIKQTIIKKLARSLAPDGRLVTGETERDLIVGPIFREEIHQTCIFIRKDAYGKY
jgi:chemotaxis methyl-accepting protein methylase